MNRRQAWICAGLVLCCLAVYAQTLTHGFINYDDGLYVTGNPHVLAGLSWADIGWSFTTERAMYVHPLTWMSHMLDCDLYGLRPWGHHLTNLIFHALSTIILFLVLARMTGRIWPSALVAALFAVHPLHVESVAWVAERKDVLSMLFWILGVGAYVWHRRRPSVRRYAATAAFFLLGFMSKPMVVTFPFVLLLLDYWPLGEVDRTASITAMARKTARLVVEKAPLFLMTAAMCAITVIMQMRGDNLSFGAKVPLLGRCANAAVVYVLYLVKTVWPYGLAVYYPHPLSRPAWQVAGAVVVLAAITLFCLRNARRRPWFIVGWLWYLGTLVPVIEIVQAGSFSHADRYTYIPLIGIFIMVAWGLDELRCSQRFTVRVMDGAAAVMVVGFTLAAIHQTACWKDSETLFRHALTVAADNALARNNLGVALQGRGHREAAREQYELALKADPKYTLATDNLGVLLYDEGKYAEAIQKHMEVLAANPKSTLARIHLAAALRKLSRYDEAKTYYEEAIAIDSESALALCGLGDLLLDLKQPDKALDAFEKVLKTNPRSREANTALGEMLANAGKPEEAAAYYAKVLRNDPYDAQASYNLGTVLKSLNRTAEAEACYREALRWKPEFPQAHNNLAGILAKTNRIDEAVAHYRNAMAADPRFADAYNNLASLLATRGNMEEARSLYEQALEIEPAYINARLNLANLLMQAGQNAQALPQLRKVLEIDPANKHAREMIAEIEPQAVPAPPPHP